MEARIVMTTRWVAMIRASSDDMGCGGKMGGTTCGTKARKPPGGGIDGKPTYRGYQLSAARLSECLKHGFTCRLFV